MAKQRRSNRKVHRGRRKKRGFSTWSLGKKIGVIAVSILLVLVVGGGAAAAAYVSSKVDKMEVKQLDTNKLEINQEVEHRTGYLNVALFGITAKEWRQAHLDSKGNIRDEASLQQLIVLANLESINAELIRQGVPQSERLLRLNASAKQMMQSLTNDHRIEKFKEYGALPPESK